MTRESQCPRPEPLWRPPPALVARSDRTRQEDPSTPIGRISLEIERVCNLRCTYCYSGASPDRGGGLSDDELRSIVDEAVDAGACLISIVAGGEPLLRRSMVADGQSCIDYANARGCYCILYTNCTLVDGGVARWLRERDVSLVGKLNSLHDDVQDELAGVRGSARRIRRGIDALLGAGLGGYERPRLALETVICRANYDELPELWRWMRQRGVVPEVEIPTMHGRAAENRASLYFDEGEAPEKYRALFDELLSLDRAEFGYDWTPHPPFPAASCRLWENNCYVNERGGVQPCAGVDQELGVLRVGARAAVGRPLRDVLGAPAFRQLRRVRELVRGACASCDLRAECYGCRAAALHKTGDPFGEDPVCWRARTKADIGRAERPHLPQLRSAPAPLACACGAEPRDP